MYYIDKKLSIVLMLLILVFTVNIDCSYSQDTKPADSPEFKKHFDLGSKYSKERKCEEAITELEKAVKINPNSSDSYFMLGRCYKRLKKVVESTNNYEKGLKINPEGSHVIFFHLGQNYFNLRQYDKSIDTLKKAIKSKPDTFFVTYFTLANAYYAKKDYSNAIIQFNRAIKLKPDYEPSYYYLSKCHINSNNHSEAVKVLNEGLKQLPNSLIMIESLGWLLSTSKTESLRDGKRAYILAQRAVDFTNAEEPNYLDTLAAAHAELGEFDKAVEIEQKAIDLLTNKNISEGFSDSNLVNYNKRLETYKDKKPWRE